MSSVAASKRIAVMTAELEALLAEPVDGSTAERTAVAFDWETFMRRCAAMTHRTTAAVAEIPTDELGEPTTAAALSTLLRISTVVLAGFAAMPAAAARPSDPGVVNQAVLDQGSVGNIVGATMGWEETSTVPMQDYSVDLPVCNNYADVGLPEVYNDPALESFNRAVMQESPTDDIYYVKQAVGVFAINGAANGAFHRILDRTGGCSGQTTTMHIDNGTTQVWTFTNGATTGTDAAWSKQEPGTDRRCFFQTRLRENVLLQAKVCESGDGGPAVNALAGAMQKALGQ